MSHTLARWCNREQQWKAAAWQVQAGHSETRLPQPLGHQKVGWGESPSLEVLLLSCDKAAATLI